MTEEARPPAVEIDAVARRFKAPDGKTFQALGPLTFDLPAGAFVAVVGPSGCGKSTWLRLIAGLDEPSAGNLKRDGAPIAGPSRGVGIVFRDHVSLPWLTVVDDVLLPAELYDLPRETARARAHELLRRVGLAGSSATSWRSFPAACARAPRYGARCSPSLRSGCSMSRSAPSMR